MTDRPNPDSLAPRRIAFGLCGTALAGAALLFPEVRELASRYPALALVGLLGVGFSVLAFVSRRRVPTPEPAPGPDPMADAMTRMLEKNHDASTALSTALLDAEFLVKLSRGSSDAQVGEVASELIGSLRRLKVHVDETRRLGQSCRGAPPPPLL